MPKLRKRKKFWIIILIVIVIGIIAAVIRSKRGEKPIEVQTGKVKTQRLVSRVTASGKIEPKKKVDISASIPGKIVRLAVEEGDTVKEGDFLLQIDSAPYEADLANARAALNGARSERESAGAALKQAEQTYLRKQRMWEQAQLISEEEFERSKTDFEVQEARVRAARFQVEQAVARLDRAKDDLDKTRVTSPMSGIVVRRAVEEGEVAVIGTMNNPGTVLLTVADLSIMEAELEVDETDIGGIQLRQPATVSIDAFPSKEFVGEVTEIGNSPIIKGTGTNQEATDFKVTITLKSPDVVLRPGLTADGEIVTAVRESCLTVPIQSLVIRDVTKGEISNLPQKEREKEGVFVMKDGKAIFRAVQTGIMGDMDMEITEGLKPDEEIVTGAYQTLRELKDGDSIHVKQEKEKKGTR